MTPLKELINKGFCISDVTEQKDNNLAFNFLIDSFKAYFRTAEMLNAYMELKYMHNESDETKLNACYGPYYAVEACNFVTRFQLFLELFIKNILLEVDPLMVYDISALPEVLHKLVKGTKVDEKDYEGANFMEFGASLDRLNSFINQSIVDNSKYGFLKDHVDMMRKVNSLRNRISHRGAFVMHHDALDELFGAYIMPFCLKLSELDGYKAIFTYGLHLDNKKIDPFKAIRNEYRKGAATNELNIHVLKLMANSAYKNKINPQIEEWMQNLFDSQRKTAERMAQAQADMNQTDLQKCPVCGCKTFIPSMDSVEEVDEDDNVTDYHEFLYDMKCYNCGLEFKYWLIANYSKITLKLPDYPKICER